METIIRTDKLYRSYSKTGSRKEQPDDIRVLKGIDLAVEEGEFVGIMGKSGCGKTTLIKQKRNWICVSVFLSDGQPVCKREYYASDDTG